MYNYKNDLIDSGFCQYIIRALYRKKPEKSTLCQCEQHRLSLIDIAIFAENKPKNRCGMSSLDLSAPFTVAFDNVTNTDQ